MNAARQSKLATAVVTARNALDHLRGERIVSAICAICDARDAMGQTRTWATELNERLEIERAWSEVMAAQEEIARAVDRGRPASPAELAALLTDILRVLRRNGVAITDEQIDERARNGAVAFMGSFDVRVQDDKGSAR